MKILKIWAEKDVFWLLLFFLLVFLIRLPVLNVSVLDWDESMYWTIAQDAANGGVPYKTTWDNKGPLLFLVFVPVIILFDNSIPALRIFTTIYLILSMYGLYLMAGYLFRGFVRLIPPLIYGLFFVIPNFQGFASNGELIMMLPVILSLLLYMSHERKRNFRLLLLSGFFSSVALFIKGSAIFSVFVVPLMFVYSFFVNESYDFKSLITKVVYYSLGFSAPFIILNLYFWSNGGLYDFYYTFFGSNRSYVEMTPLSEGLMNTYRFMHRTIASDYEVFTLGAISSAIYLLIELIRKRYTDEEKNKLYFILALLALSFIGVLSGKRMYAHYYLQMALPYSLVVGFAIYKLRLSASRIKSIIVIIILVFLIQSPLQKLLSFKNKIKTYHSVQQQPEDIARYIRNNTTSDEKILVLGGQPIIYFLSDRRSPIRVFWWNDIHVKTLKRIAYFDVTFVQKLNKDKPAYIVIYDGEDHRQRLGFEYFGEYINKNYSFEITLGEYKLYRLNET